MKKVVITADDFGAAGEVNEAVERAHRRGVLTAASLMVGAPAVADAVERARSMPTLRVGLHLVLTEGAPTSPPDLVPDLLGPDGRFRNDMARMGLDIFLRPRTRDQLRREINAQFEAFARTGLALDHVNAHKHFHLHPTIAAEVIAVGRSHGMRSARAPREPGAIVAEVDGVASGGPDLLTAPWTAMLRRRFASAGVATPDQVFGLAWSGAFTTERLKGLLDHLPEGLSEIYLHPAVSGRFAGAAPGYRYADELKALLDPAVAAALAASGAARGGFADFV